MRTLRPLAAVVLALLAACPAAAAAVGQPPQQTTGPGAAPAPHGDVRVVEGGVGDDAWFLYLPASPRPASGPLAVITHGYFEFSGHGMNDAIARHTAREGSVVVYPRWQTGVVTPCPGPADIEPCLRSETSAIKGALAHLAAHPELPQPQLDRTSYFGFSFGGIITANLVSQWRARGVPEPRAVFLDDPHDGGFTGAHEPALAADLGGIPATAKVVCHSGAHGVFDDAYTGAPGDPGEVGRPKRDGTCNAVFPRLTSVPPQNKSLVLTSEDPHGQPALSSDHGVCAGPGSDFAVDAYDWGFCWRQWDALRACALERKWCEYALGDTPEHRYVGTWSDGVPIVGLKVQGAAPIRADPTPARQAAPPVDQPPTSRITRIVRGSAAGALVRGTAADDHGLRSVDVAVQRRTGSRCRPLRAGGRLGAPASCGGRLPFRRADGTGAWTARLHRRLQPGRYRVTVRATDLNGNVQAATTRRAFVAR